MEEYTKLRKSVIDHLKISKNPVRTPDLHKKILCEKKVLYIILDILENDGEIIKCEPIKPKDAFRWKIAPKKEMIFKK